MFDSPEKLALGLLTGIVFGFLLQKGRAAKYHVIVGQFLLKDWTVVKIMLTAVLVGSVGVYALVQTGWASLHIRPALLGGVLVGGVCFGIGIVVFGYCPGTSVAACGEGRRDAMVGVLGMLFGAGLFVALFSTLQSVIKGLGDLGKITVPEAFGIPTWTVIGSMIVVGGLAFWLIGRWERTKSPPASESASDRKAESAGVGIDLRKHRGRATTA
jgi:uncharacterized membrane protein YedE/YeeE